VVSREGEGTRFTIVLREALAPAKMERAA